MDTPIPNWALMQSVSPALGKCALTFQSRQPIDVNIALRQQEHYTEVLRSLGLAVTMLPSTPDFPDGCFVEDTAVVLGDTAVICRFGAASRKGEESAIRQVLQTKEYRLIEMKAPATADGGDVLLIDNDVFIGLSSRTNEFGARILAEAATAASYTAHFIEVAGALHLKTVCTYAGGKLLLCDRKKLGQGARTLDCFQVFEPPIAESVGCNVVRIGNCVCVPAGCPATMRAVKAASLEPIAVDISELHKAEAGLSCLVLFGS